MPKKKIEIKYEETEPKKVEVMICKHMNLVETYQGLICNDCNQKI